MSSLNMCDLAHLPDVIQNIMRVMENMMSNYKTSSTWKSLTSYYYALITANNLYLTSNNCDLNSTETKVSRNRRDLQVLYTSYPVFSVA